MSDVGDRVNDLSKSFDTFQALSGVTFSVEEGETFGFLGQNGAEKTTTRTILTGISSPTRGSAKIFGHDIVKETIAARKLIGVFPETSNIYDDLSAWRNLMFSAELYGMPRSIRHAGEKNCWICSACLEERTTRHVVFPRV